MAETTLRDALSSAFNEAEGKVQSDVTVQTEQKAEDTRTAEERARDEQGRFAKTEEQKQPKTPSVTTPVEQTARPPRPSSWKKDYWDHWDKLDPSLAGYISQREQEFAKGVSTYKSEADKAKELIEAFNPYQPLLQQHGLTPVQAIQRLMQAEQVLRNSSPQERIQHFARLAQDYGVPLQMLHQGQEQNPQVMALYEQINQLQGQWKNFQTLQEQQVQLEAQNEIENFAKDHEYLDQVKDRMAEFLQAGVAQDLKSAYDMAMRLDDNLFAQMQQQQREQAEKAKREAEAQRVASARAKTVSVKTSTPANSGQSERKGRKAALEDAFDQLTG